MTDRSAVLIVERCVEVPFIEARFVEVPFIEVRFVEVRFIASPLRVLASQNALGEATIPNHEHNFRSRDSR